MKKLMISALIGSFILAGCSANLAEREMIVDGQALAVKLVNIPSFKIEVSPHKAICKVTNTAGETVEAECLQYRQLHQRNFNTFSGEIQGFEFEPNNRYVLDVRQETVTDEASGEVKPVWILNEVVSQVAETLPE